MRFYISGNITLKTVMLPQKLIYKSAFLFHLIKKNIYCLMLIAPQVADELFATLIAV